MPRKYIPKSKPSYSAEDLKDALNMVKKKDISVLEASKRFHIPQATIYSRISGSRSDNARGRRTILTNDEEMFLVHAIKMFQQWQQPISTSTVRQIAKAYMLELGKNISAKTNLRDWFAGFLARWSTELKVAKSMKLEKIRSKGCTKDVAGECRALTLLIDRCSLPDKWFEHLHSVMDKLKLFHRPDAIWNVDESGFGDDPGRRQVVIKRSSKYAIASHSGSGKYYTTVIMCTSAAGE
jgi:hypothetical protein